MFAQTKPIPTLIPDPTPQKQLNQSTVKYYTFPGFPQFCSSVCAQYDTWKQRRDKKLGVEVGFREKEVYIKII